jgi:hypothetical protein
MHELVNFLPRIHQSNECEQDSPLPLCYILVLLHFQPLMTQGLINLIYLRLFYGVQHRRGWGRKKVRD